MARFVARRNRITRKGRKWPVTKELDALLRRIVMARDRETCRRCGKGKVAGRGGGIETAHIYPKGKYQAMRYRLDNVLALCHACHHHFAHKDPINFAAWVRGELGDKAMDRLAVVAASPGKVDRDGDRLYLLNVGQRWGIMEEVEAVRPKRRKR